MKKTTTYELLRRDNRGAENAPISIGHVNDIIIAEAWVAAEPSKRGYVSVTTVVYETLDEVELSMINTRIKTLISSFDTEELNILRNAFKLGVL